MKKAIVGFCIACAALSVNASYLYWQVENGDFTEESYNSATLWVSVDGGSNYTVASNVEYVQGGQSYEYSVGRDTVSPSTGIGYVANIGGDYDTSTYSYYVELANNTHTVARSATVTSAAGAHEAYISAAELSVSLPNLANVTPFHATSYTAVPEPTSAILMLFGAAMLGLKRKNRSIA